MTSVNAAGMDVVGDGNPTGTTLGKDTLEKVGSHGSVSVQVTVTAEEAVDKALSALHDKGIINYTGTAATIGYASPMRVFDPEDGEGLDGEGEIVLGQGGGYDYSGIVRSSGILTFQSNDDGSFDDESDFRFEQGGGGYATTRVATLENGNWSVIGSLAATGVVTGGGGGANSGAAENVSVLGVSEVTLAPTGGGTRYYNFTNKVDGQQLFITVTGTDDVQIDASASASIYMSRPGESNATARWNATTSKWVGTKGNYLSL